MGEYNKLSLDMVAELHHIIGVEHVLLGADIPEKYGYDAGTKDNVIRPEAVLFPENAQEIAAILIFANRHKIPVTPRGGGSGLAGAAIALRGGILLDLKRMNRILQIDPEAKYIVVEPAVRTLDIQTTANKHGLLYAGDPCSSDDCVIAGNIATNAGGNRAVKYGVTGDQVYELELVTPLGAITTLGGRLKKNSTGYGLVRLIAGSEGTLGIITKATLKLQKLAPLLPNFFAVFPNLTTVAKTVNIILEESSLETISLELIDRRTLQAIERYLDKKLFFGEAGDGLIIQLEAQSEEEALWKKRRLQQLCQEHGCLYVEETDGETIWYGRRQWGKAIDIDQPVGVSEDLVVPVNHIVAFIETLEKLTREFTFDFRIAGHAGDGNMHVKIFPGATPLSEWKESLAEFRGRLYAETYSLGGRLSGEHGIGMKRKTYFQALVKPEELELMKAVKKAFDPNGILNPGKIFDEKFTG